MAVWAPRSQAFSITLLHLIGDLDQFAQFIGGDRFRLPFCH
jgi:hypothetical protein